MRRLKMIIVATAAMLLPAAASGQSYRSTCADCHFARPEAPAQDHLFNWEHSLHGRNNVGCEKCHGGNASTFEQLQAHAGLLTADAVKSPVNRRNLPATCGACHVGPFVAFQDSRHYELLKSGKPDGPTCSTCHETVGGRLLSAKALEARCASCHGAAEIAPRAGRPQAARQIYERLAGLRLDFKAAQGSIKKVRDPARRALLLDAYGQAEVPLIRAVNAGHRFVYDDLVEYSELAQKRIDALLMMIDSEPAR
jgi:cytochrome c554/c'-like protein